MIRTLTTAASLFAAGTLAACAGRSAQASLYPVLGGIDSCETRWMARDDVTIGNGTDTRTGFDPAVDRFCNAADGKTVRGGGYLSMVTEVFLNSAKNPTQYGTLGFVYFEVNNKIDADHVVYSDSCKQYLKALSADGGQCTGAYNDTTGGTWQVGNDEVTYHAIGELIPCKQDALNKLWTDGPLKVQSVNKGSRAPLNPWPFSSLDKIKPVPCHSHNDYDQAIPLWSALAAGCLTAEADVWSGNPVLLGHTKATAGRTFSAQYVEPLKAILDYNNGNKPNGPIGVYPADPDQTFVLFIDFKTSNDETLNQVVAALQPLRDAGYLSYYDDAAGKFVSRHITAVASGSSPFDRIRRRDGVPNADLFYDAKLSPWNSSYSVANSYYASADFNVTVGHPENVDQFTQEQKERLVAEATQAHAAGLLVRYWNLPGEWIWESIAALGVDRLNADDMSNTARLRRI